MGYTDILNMISSQSLNALISSCSSLLGLGFKKTLLPWVLPLSCPFGREGDAPKVFLKLKIFGGLLLKLDVCWDTCKELDGITDLGETSVISYDAEVLNPIVSTFLSTSPFSFVFCFS